MASPPPLPDLPVVDSLAPLRQALSTEHRAVLVAPPGAGKTTVVPLALLAEPWLGEQRIVMLEPRRLATRAAAQRMAATTDTDIGALVGYQTRDERRIGPDARIEVVTEGVLTRRLQNDPELPGVGCVVFDEVHERNLPTDLGLALTLDVIESIRPDLRLLAMSATPDTDGLVGLLGCDVVESLGRMFDVELRWLPGRPPARKGRRGPTRVGADVDADAASAVLQALGDEAQGDILVFLPGIAEIRRTQRRLTDVLGPNIDVLPLAGALPIAEQDAALAPSSPGRRRVVLSTDIAETSLTVSGVRIVVDAGLAREPRFDPRSGMSRLTTVATSRASADQRTGRAGRTEPGVSYRLWSKIEHGSRARHRTPEILQADLAQLALELAAWGNGDDLRWIDAPPPGALAQARDLLTDLHALDDDGSITPLGRTMMALPVHPRLARMVAVEQDSLSCLVSALIDDRDVFRGRPSDLPADLSLRVLAVTGRAGDDRADRGALHRARDRARDLARRARIDFDLDRVDASRTGAVLLLAYPDRLAARRRPGQFQLRAGSGAFLDREDPLGDEPFIVAADLDGTRDRARIRLAAAVDESEILHNYAGDITERRDVRWDADRGDLVETLERRLGAITLSTVARRPQPSEETTAVLMSRLRATKLDELPWTDAARSLRRRVAYLHRTVGEPWPDWSTDALVRGLDEWLAPYLPGATGRDDLRALDVTMVLRSQLPWPQADLDELAPPTLELPTGRSVPIDYGGETPTASVRVQDLFGVTEHPTVGGQPLRLELLSPADRPIQVTSDLPGFWAGSWTDVRKDMAGRYPKHRWPEDPADAAPRRLKRRDGD